MQRITQKDLERLVEKINVITGSPEASYTRQKDGKTRSNVDNYHLDYAYGGVALHRMVNENGGIHDIFGGHAPKRELYDKMHAYIAGARTCKSL